MLDKQETIALNTLDDDKLDLVVDYSIHIVNHAGRGLWDGVKDTGAFAWEAVRHPSIVYEPIMDVVYDATLIASAHINDVVEDNINELTPQFTLDEKTANIRLLNYIKTNEQEYQNAVERMTKRVNLFVDGVDGLKQRFVAADTKGRVGQASYGTAYAISTFLVPSWFLKGVGAVAKGANNIHKLGTLSYPRVFHNSKWDDIKFPLPAVDTLTLNDVRMLSGTHELMYVVLENQHVVVSPLMRKHPFLLGSDGAALVSHILHPELSRLQPVIGAGHMGVLDGQISSLNALSGHFLPNGHSLKKMVERSFFDAGYLEAMGKFKPYHFKHRFSQAF